MKPGVPEFWSQDRADEHARKTAQVANQLQKGQGNNSFKTTLTTGQTTTEILVSFARENHMALFSPQDQATATAIAAGEIWAEVENGKVTIHHGTYADSRVLGVALFG
jgi:hypothetical protein